MPSRSKTGGGGDRNLFSTGNEGISKVTESENNNNEECECLEECEKLEVSFSDQPSCPAANNPCVSEFSTEQMQQVQKLLEEFLEVYTNRVGSTGVVTHQIQKGDVLPIKERPYRLSPLKQRVLKEQVHEMLMAGLIEPSDSAMVLTHCNYPKGRGKRRVCVDFH